MNKAIFSKRVPGQMLLALALGALAGALPAGAQAPQIPGSSTQVTTGPDAQSQAQISGTLVCYTDSSLSSAGPNVFYHDLANGITTQITNSTGSQDQYSGCDVSGSTIVFVHYGPGTGQPIGDVLGFTIGTGIFNIAVGPTVAHVNPRIGPADPTVPGSGQIVVWQQNTASFPYNYDVYAEDLSTGVQKRLTTVVPGFGNGGTTTLGPVVWGRLVAYSVETLNSVGASLGCQIFVTNFDTLATTQLTSTSGCNDSPDIFGDHVVYAADRAGTGNPHIFVYNLATNAETQVPLQGFQQFPRISGEWVSFENFDVSTGADSVYLYSIPFGTIYTAVPGPTFSSSPIQVDSDGFRVTYTGLGADNQDHIFEFAFASPLAYVRHNPATGSSTLGVLSPSGALADLFSAGNSLTALTFTTTNLGYGPDFFYYLRQSTTGWSTFGTISPTGAVRDRFLVGKYFDALTFVAANLGYGPNLFYYLRHDPATGYSTFGTISLSGVVRDRFFVGKDFDALTFAAANLGYGPDLFYYLRHDPATGYSTFGTISLGGVVRDRFLVGKDFNALTFNGPDEGYGANLFYYLRHDSAGFSTFGTLSTSGVISDRFGLGYDFDTLAAGVP